MTAKKLRYEIYCETDPGKPHYYCYLDEAEFEKLVTQGVDKETALEQASFLSDQKPVKGK